MKDSRATESWRMESVCPRPPKRTSWCATRPGRRTEWIGSCTVPPASRIRSAVRLAVPEGASSFCSWWSSITSHSGMWAAAWRANSIISTAPIAKLGATNRLAGPTPSNAEKSAPVVPITQWTPASRQVRALSTAASGVEKSTTTSASPNTSPREVSSCGSTRPTSAMSSVPSTASRTVRPMRPAAPDTATLIIASRRGELGVHRLERRAKCLLVAADPRGGQPVGSEERPGQHHHVLHRHRVEGCQQRVDGEDRNPHQERAAEPVHAGQRRLHRQHGAALDVLAGALELLLPHPDFQEASQLGADHVHGRPDIVGPGTDVDRYLARVGVVTGVGEDRVGEAALLTDLLEEPRRSRAAQDRVEHPQREAAIVASRYPGGAEAEVVLLGGLAVEGDRRAVAVRGLGAVGGPAMGVVEGRCGELHDPFVLHAAGGRDDHVGADVAG